MIVIAVGNKNGSKINKNSKLKTSKLTQELMSLALKSYTKEHLLIAQSVSWSDTCSCRRKNNTGNHIQLEVSAYSLQADSDEALSHGLAIQQYRVGSGTKAFQLGYAAGRFVVCVAPSHQPGFVKPKYSVLKV